MIIKLSNIDKTNKNDGFVLNKKLLGMLNELLILRVQLKMGQLKQLHLLKRLRYDIAVLKFVLSKNWNFYKKKQ